MIDGANILIQDLPIEYGDPLSLAGSQASGKLTLIVVCYPSGPVYDAFVCKPPLLIMAAHVTPAFKFQVPVAHALTRFYRAREEGLPVTLSMYEVEKSLLSLFLETVYFEPSLKLSMDGAGQEFIRGQIERTACKDGILELGDFSDPLHSVITLCPVNSVLTAQAWLDEIFESCSTRSLQLYDRKKHQKVARDRGAAAPDVHELLEQAAHLSERFQEEAARALHLATGRKKASIKTSEEAKEVERQLKKQTEEMQMKTDALLHREMAALLAGTPALLLDEAAEDHQPEHADGALATVAIAVDDPGTVVSSDAAVPNEEGRRALLSAIRKVHQTVLGELSRQFGEERANILVRQAAETAGLQLPVSDLGVLPFLQALVTSKPPGRWMRFKRKMNEIKDVLAADLTALFAEYNQFVDDPLMLGVSELWRACSKG